MPDPERLNEEASQEDASPERPFQFGLRWLLIVTAIVAAALGILRAMNLPVLLYLLSAVYTTNLLLYFLLRGVHQWRSGMRLRRKVFAQRKELADWVETQRSSPQEGGQTGPIPGPTNPEATDL